MNATKQALIGAAEEIRSLRKQNELMAARLQVFDQMMLLFVSSPNYGSRGAMRPDPLYEVEKLLAEKYNDE